MDLLSRLLIKPCSEELLASDGKVDLRTKYPHTGNDYMMDLYRNLSQIKNAWSEMHN